MPASTWPEDNDPMMRFPGISFFTRLYQSRPSKNVLEGINSLERKRSGDEVFKKRGIFFYRALQFFWLVEMEGGGGGGGRDRFKMKNPFFSTGFHWMLPSFAAPVRVTTIGSRGCEMN